MQGTTPNGFNYKVDDTILTDWRFISELVTLTELEDSEAKEIDFMLSMRNIEKILFKDKGKALEKFIASQNDGAVPLDKLLTELLSVIKLCKDTKNS